MTVIAISPRVAAAAALCALLLPSARAANIRLRSVAIHTFRARCVSEEILPANSPPTESQT